MKHFAKTLYNQLITSLFTLLMLIPQSCSQKETEPVATSNGPKKIDYHQLILECTNLTSQNKGVAILDFRFDTYDGGIVGFASGKYVSFNTPNYTSIDAAIQAANAAIGSKAAEVQTVPTLTDFVVSRLSKVSGYAATKDLSGDAVWGILGHEKTLIARLDTKSSEWKFDVEQFLTALIATPAQAQGDNSIQAALGGQYHSNYFYSPPPQPGSPLPEYRMNAPAPVTAPMPSNSTPGQRSAAGETPNQRATRENAEAEASVAGRAPNQSAQGRQAVRDALGNIYNGLGDVYNAARAGRSAGDPHVYSHDGRVYGFQTVGEFVATKGNNFEVQARQEDAYKTGSAAVNTGVAARLGADEICFLVNPAALNAPRLFVNKKETALSALAQVSLSGGNKLQLVSPEKILFSNAQGEGVVIYWNTPYLDYAVTLGNARKGAVMGLMGNYDGDPGNDGQLSNGTTPPVDHTFKTIHTLFADSWRVTNQTSLFVYEAGKNTDSFTDRAFPKTFPVLDPDKLKWAEGVCQTAGITRQPELGQCIFDVGITGDTRLAQSAMLSQREFPASADVGVFTNLKVDLKEGQSNDPQTRNLLDLDNGIFYRFGDGASVAADIDVIFEYYAGPWFAGPRAVKNCGVSCGAYSIWPNIEQQKWPFFANTFLRYTTIPANQWDTFGNAADLRRAWTFDTRADEKTELVTGLTDLNTSAPLTRFLWSFKTQQGKKGLIRFTQASVDKTGNKATFTFDVKIER